jgi:hypothetical protein
LPVYSGSLAQLVQCAWRTGQGSGSGFFRFNRRSCPVFKTMQCTRGQGRSWGLRGRGETGIKHLKHVEKLHSYEVTHTYCLKCFFDIRRCKFTNDGISISNLPVLSLTLLRTMSLWQPSVQCSLLLATRLLTSQNFKVNCWFQLLILPLKTRLNKITGIPMIDLSSMVTYLRVQKASSKPMCFYLVLYCHAYHAWTGYVQILPFSNWYYVWCCITAQWSHERIGTKPFLLLRIRTQIHPV